MIKRYKNSILVILSVALVVGCSADKKSGGADGISDIAEKTRILGVDEKQVEDAQPSKQPEMTRAELLADEYSHYEDVLLQHNAADLSGDEREMLRHLAKAAGFIEELHMLQIHPENLNWWEQVSRSGSELEQNVYARYQMPWCHDIKDAKCKAYADAPERSVGYGQWPDVFDRAQVTSLANEINGKELLSPFTVVRQNGEGRLEAVPYSAYDLYASKMAIVAAELRAAAEYAGHKSLKRFLNSRADALEAKEAFPYDQSDYHWIALKGDWDVTIGPYEVYKDPYKKKAAFQMYFGRVDKELAGALGKLKKNLQEMENALAELLGEHVYKSRKLDKRIAIRVIDVWTASGGGRSGAGAVAAFHLPNRGASVDEGLYKKVIMTNHIGAFVEVAKKRAELILTGDLLPYMDARADVFNVTFHELAHGFGAYHEMVIKDRKGRTTTVDGAMGEYGPLFEELKADTLGQWLIGFQQRSGWLKQEDVRRRYVTGLMHSLGLFQYDMQGTYPQMAAIELGWYLEKGAVIWDSTAGRLAIDFAKLPAAIESLVEAVATYQLRGDFGRAEKLYAKYMTKADDGTVRLLEPLQEIRNTCLKRYKKAGLKSPALRYEILGLENPASENAAAETASNPR